MMITNSIVREKNSAKKKKLSSFDLKQKSLKLVHNPVMVKSSVNHKFEATLEELDYE